MINWRGALYISTFALALAVGFYERKIRAEMEDAIDWHRPDLVSQGPLEKIFRDVVSEYRKMDPASSLLRRHKRLAIVGIGLMILLVVEVAVLQNHIPQ